jgi:hypothetical protein
VRVGEAAAMPLTERTWTALRWTACGALLTAAVGLVVGFGHDDRPSSAPVDASSSTTPAGEAASVVPSKPAPTSSAPRRIRTAVPTAVATATPRPGPDPLNAGAPHLPAEAQGLTIASAEAFARFYFDQASNYLKRTGDGSVVRAWSEPSCGSCRDRLAYFAAVNGRARRLSGDYVWRSTQVRQVQLDGQRSAVVDVDSRTGVHAAVERRGARPVRFPGGISTFTMTLVARSGNWAVLDLELT